MLEDINNPMPHVSSYLGQIDETEKRIKALKDGLNGAYRLHHVQTLQCTILPLNQYLFAEAKNYSMFHLDTCVFLASRLHQNGKLTAVQESALISFNRVVMAAIYSEIINRVRQEYKY